MKPAISVQNLSKQYRIGLPAGLGNNLTENLRRQARTAWDKVSRLVSPNKEFSKAESFWALKDVSFEVQPGEVVGIIGRNGAGKSTLLKILSQIVEPTSGHADIRGRMGSLLEVGTGFHPELTGRENVYLNGSILGMKRSEISQNFDAIVEFSGIDSFIDTPVKRYSSGMYVRLAFAVAAFLEPEILIVDEVLAVGDAAFQKKCLAKVRQIGGEGRTVLIVSHNIAVIEQLSDKVVLMRDGRTHGVGPPNEVIPKYLSETGAVDHAANGLESRRPNPRLGREIEFVSLRTVGTDAGYVRGGEPLKIGLTLRSNSWRDAFRFSYTVFRSDGTPVGSAFSPEEHHVSPGETDEIVLDLGDLRLAPGHYSIGCALGTGDFLSGHRDFDLVMDVLPFEVTPPRSSHGVFPNWPSNWGIIRFPEPRASRCERTLRVGGQA